MIGGLHEFLGKFQSDINFAGQSIFNTYFALPEIEPTTPTAIPIETQ